jgi:hypothetical protein
MVLGTAALHALPRRRVWLTGAKLRGPAGALSFKDTQPSDSARCRLGLAKAHWRGDVSSVPRVPATRFMAACGLDEEHVGKPNLSKQLRRDAQD